MHTGWAGEKYGQENEIAKKAKLTGRLSEGAEEEAFAVEVGTEVEEAVCTAGVSTRLDMGTRPAGTGRDCVELLKRDTGHIKSFQKMYSSGYRYYLM